MKTAYLVHGFNVRDDGANTIDRIAPAIESRGIRVLQVDYGFALRIRVRLCNRGIALVLARLAEPHSIGIGHSNGCAILHMAAKYGAPFRQLIYINPALDADAAAPPSRVKRVDVWHSQGDPWPRLARWIPFSPWGAMGTYGYQGADPRFHNHRHDLGHSGLFGMDGFGENLAAVLES